MLAKYSIWKTVSRWLKVKINIGHTNMLDCNMHTLNTSKCELGTYAHQYTILSNKYIIQLLGTVKEYWDPKASDCYYKVLTLVLTHAFGL